MEPQPERALIQTSFLCTIIFPKVEMESQPERALIQLSIRCKEKDTCIVEMEHQPERALIQSTAFLGIHRSLQVEM